MTAISNILSSAAIAAASDSFLTLEGVIKEASRPKIVCVVPLRLAVSYWGLAKTTNGFDTFEFIKDFCVRHKSATSLTVFATNLRDELNQNQKLQRVPANQRGLGIHLAAFEDYNSVSVPELILCTNFQNTTYTQIADQFSCSRESNQRGRDINSTSPDERREFHRNLGNLNFDWFNNGDPGLFNQGANAVAGMIGELSRRNALSTTSMPELCTTLVRQPILLISQMQRRVCKREHRIVGGCIYDVMIRPTGQVTPSSRRIPVIH